MGDVGIKSRNNSSFTDLIINLNSYTFGIDVLLYKSN